MVPFTFSPMGLISENGQDSSNNDRHRQNAKYWLKYGIFFLSANNGKELFRQVLTEIKSDDARKAWKEAYKYAIQNNRMRFVDEPQNWECIENLVSNTDLKNMLGVICCHREDCGNYTESDSRKPELCPFESFHASRSFEESIENAQKTFFKDEDVEEIWEKHFKFFARYSKNIRIIDRYLIENVCGNNSHCLDNFLVKVSRENSCPNIQVISRRRDTRDRTEVQDLDSIREILISHGFTKGEIFSCPEGAFIPYGHDRYLIFDDDVCTVGKGLSLFRSNKVLENNRFAWKREVLKDYSKIISQLRAKKTAIRKLSS